MRIPIATGLLALLLAGTASSANGNGDTTTFEGGANPQGWSFNVTVPDVIETSGGNPGAWLHNSGIDSFAPILTTGATAAAPWIGDYRAQGITKISFDARTDAATFGAVGRNMSLLLRDTKGTPLPDDDDYAYYVGPLVPQPGSGWVHYEVPIPSASTAQAPRNWTGGWAGDPANFRPGVEWSDVITNVDRVEIWWIDPSFFAIFQTWNVGVDNLSIDCDPGPWYDLENSLAGGGFAAPQLSGSGPLTGASTATFDLSGASPNATVFAVAGLAASYEPNMGGIQVPDAQRIVPRMTTASGTDSLSWTVPAGVQPGMEIYAQYWIPDPNGPQGFLASNGLLGVAP